MTDPIGFNCKLSIVMGAAIVVWTHVLWKIAVLII